MAVRHSVCGGRGPGWRTSSDPEERRPPGRGVAAPAASSGRSRSTPAEDGGARSRESSPCRTSPRLARLLCRGLHCRDSSARTGVVDVGEGQVAMWICVSGLALRNACMTAPSRWPRPNPKVLTTRGFPAGRGARRSATSSIAGSARAARTRKARPLSGRETRRVVRSAYASRGTQTGPGDLLDSRTCQDGCLAELWGRHGHHVRPPLQAGHVVTATV